MKSLCSETALFREVYLLEWFVELGYLASIFVPKGSVNKSIECTFKAPFHWFLLCKAMNKPIQMQV